MKKKNKLKKFLTEKRNHLTLKGNYDLERKITKIIRCLIKNEEIYDR